MALPARIDWPGQDELLLPEVAASRCVHSQAAVASCRACVDRCPTGAWVIDDARLGIDPQRCDGCGLCAAVCPEGAIAERHAPARYAIEGIGVALAACTQTRLPAQDVGPDEGLLPCLHLLGIPALLGLYRSGVRRLVLCRGHCQTCRRGRGTGIEEHLERVQQLLRERRLDPLDVVELDPEAWPARSREIRARHRAPGVDRRAFFRGILTAAADTAAELSTRTDPQQADFVPPGRLLPRPEPSRFSLHAPRIDPLRCTGCDACARLCPHAVIRIEALAYRFDADGCTGCGLCTDVCATGAVSVSSPDPAACRELALRPGHCPACGLGYHLPEAQAASAGRLCPICAANRHHERLFQVDR